MTPIILLLAMLPTSGLLHPVGRAGAGLLVTNILDLFSTEFIFRGFLMLSLARYFGPIALVIALFPFTFEHLTKPETELLSTFVGGAIYGWFAGGRARSCGARRPTCTSSRC